ncbi:hypothetical protein AB0H49_22515 [Nocardia sp. NPDC050713]|uniref:hypothetical protein n=1 Tax=Nocardia sp. NPDC050713 TaxID=3154511 RepID=UPI0033CBF608
MNEIFFDRPQARAAGWESTNPLGHLGRGGAPFLDSAAMAGLIRDRAGSLTPVGAGR